MKTAPAVIPAVLDRLDGVRIYADLTPTVTVRLGCGCYRHECDRPGGGRVHILRGQHCQPSP